MSFKVAFIGAGSIGFTRGLLADLLTVPEFHDIEVSFMDINPDNLRMVTQLCQRDIDENGLNIKIHATLDRREAFKDARYVINCVRIGMLEAFATDVEIPLKYGVDQCVGDTLCIGGIMYGQRGVNAILDFCRDIREVAAPGCILLNYSNPCAMMTWAANKYSNPCAMMTWAANKYGGVETYGLCHGVQHGHEQIAKALGREKKDVDIICAGLNHQTWYISVKTDGKERTGELYELMKAQDFAKDENIRLSISATTRAPRGTEQDGVEYHFMTKEGFEQLIGENGFIEYAKYVDNYYGTPRRPVEQWMSQGKDVILEIEVQGCEKVKSAIPGCISIFLSGMFAAAVII